MAKIEMFVPALDLPNEYYAAIGEIAARWSWLEWQLGVIIRTCLKLGNKEGRLLTVGMSMKPKAHIVRGFAGKWIRNKRLQERMRKLSRGILNKLDDRDDCVHGIFGHLKGKPDEIRRLKLDSAEERILPPAKIITSADIKKLGRELKELQERAARITRELKALPG